MSAVQEASSLEEGECSSEDEITGYTPIERPTADITSNQRPATHNIVPDSDSEDEGPLGLPGGQSDSDEDRPSAKKRNVAGPWGRRDALVPDTGNNETFKQMAAAFQAERKKDKRKNNVWGSILQEDSLNKDLSGIGVKRTIKELNSDRGAEAYDFSISSEIHEKERQKRREERKNEVDEMASYWGEEKKPEEENMESEPGDVENTLPQQFGKQDTERRGTKRSVKERLGKSKIYMDRFHGQMLAEPGKPKQLIDIGDEDFLETSEKEFAKILAERLGEEKPELIEGVVMKFGKSAAHKVYKLTQKKENEGGIEINNGARRRTSGGVFLYLLKTDPDTGLNIQEVKKFLNDSRKQEERKVLEAKSRKSKKDFDKEMQEFLSLRKDMKETEEEEMEEGEKEKEEGGEAGEEEEIIQNIGSNAFGGLIGKMKSKSVTSFNEPDAPPNSVERSDSRNLQEYDDDLFAETENIELL